MNGFFKAAGLSALTSSVLLAMASCGSSGLEFNGSGTNNQINPRTSQITHFPLPIETFRDQKEPQVWEIDRDVRLNGRAMPNVTLNDEQNLPPWAHPQTAAMPVTPGVFTIKANTDIWDMIDTDEFPTPPNMVADRIDAGFNNQATAEAMSVICQWLVQDVTGNPRNDTPIVYENLQFEAIPFSITLNSNISPAAPGFAGRQFQYPVSTRITPGGTQNPPADPVFTANPNSNLWGPALDGIIVPGQTMPGLANSIKMGSGNMPPALLYATWAEARAENLFIEASNGALVDVPIPAYFSATGRATVSGGCMVLRLDGNVEASYSTGQGQTPMQIAFYYLAVVIAHQVGIGVGVPEVAFVRPGVSNGEEDVMNVNVQLDMSFYVAAERRFQFTSEGLLHMQNTNSYPLGSAERAFAQSQSFMDQFNTQGILMNETMPGPRRSP